MCPSNGIAPWKMDVVVFVSTFQTKYIMAVGLHSIQYWSVHLRGKKNSKSATYFLSFAVSVICGFSIYRLRTLATSIRREHVCVRAQGRQTERDKSRCMHKNKNKYRYIRIRIKLLHRSDKFKLYLIINLVEAIVHGIARNEKNLAMYIRCCMHVEQTLKIYEWNELFLANEMSMYVCAERALCDGWSKGQ